MKSGAQAGFTLIELIVVIVILGILAATAIPKFIDMSTDARVAKMQAAAGALKAGAALYHAQWLVSGSPADGNSVKMEGQAITGVGGYPTADAAGIGLAAGITAPDYEIGSTGGFSVTPDATRTKCKVTYPAPTATVAPVVAVALDPADCK
ncbi:type II secretion system protein [Janthinobacterium sp. BJB401]|nr:type II secretion system protein [Janthinobacterium sp. BJB401]